MTLVHKAAKLSQLKLKGFMGWFERALCNTSLTGNYSTEAWQIPKNYKADHNIKRNWKDVNCKQCLSRKTKRK